MAKVYIVGTPIGNMQDITLRALETLKMVDFIACEDTRFLLKLMNYFKIPPKQIIVYNDKNKVRAVPKIIELVLAGKNVAQVSDAGMPTINDPGYMLIKMALQKALSVEVIPGVSVVTTTNALANMGSNFSFHGFLHYAKFKRKSQLAKLLPGTHIFFLSPHRIQNELEDIKAVCGNHTKVFLGRELTKKFETHYRGSIGDVIKNLVPKAKGEFTIAIQIPKNQF